jgi:hypothetical protein
MPEDRNINPRCPENLRSHKLGWFQHRGLLERSRKLTRKFIEVQIYHIVFKITVVHIPKGRNLLLEERKDGALFSGALF